MNVRIKLFDSTLPVPSYQTEGAAAFDLYARIETVIQPRSIAYIPLNIAIDTPEGYWVLVTARSSTHKAGIMPIHGIGVGDSDYRGDGDEYKFPAYNFTDEPVTIARGQRIAQAMILPVNRVSIEVVESLGSTDRGGFGSTGR